MTRIIVLGGGPGGERDVSLESARAVADALASDPRFDADYREIERLDARELEALGPGVIFPALHGPWGEGGELQRLMEAQGRAFVGSTWRSAAIAMDKAQTLDRAVALDIPVAGHCRADELPEQPPIEPPLIVKPVADGSSVGVRICRSLVAYREARRAIGSDQSARGPWLIERFVAGRELTVSFLDGEILPIVEIVPRDGFYDYDAKYRRDDTRYVPGPNLPPAAESALIDGARAIYRDLGLRHLARADFILDKAGIPRFLEINTMPGFTSHSLLPMAARARGIDFPDLCARLVDLALRDAQQPMVCP